MHALRDAQTENTRLLSSCIARAPPLFRSGCNFDGRSLMAKNLSGALMVDASLKKVDMKEARCLTLVTCLLEFPLFDIHTARLLTS